MFKRITASALAVCSLVSVLSVTSLATGEKNTTMQAIGIVDGSENLSGQVTRGDFSEMLVNASIYADTVGTGYGYSLYTDVKSDHTQSAYIKTAVENGWMTGYIDGSFRPDQAMKLEEAVSALIKLLGYTNEDLVGAYPYAHLSKASSLGLLDGVSAQQGQYISTDVAIDLVYNALLAETKDGKIHGESLGYTITGDDIDYASLVTEGTKGPYVTYDGQISVPFSSSTATIYLNGEEASLADISSYDVYYYHTDMNSVWVYDNKITGTITALSPSEIAPTAVTVSGNIYNIGTSNATHQLSSQGTYNIGDTVTLLLGMDGKVTEVVSGTEVNNVYYGIALGSETTLSATGEYTQISTQIACTDGIIRTFLHDGSSYEDGEEISVKVTSNGVSVSSLSSKSLSGTVNSDGTKIGSYTLADNVQIIDTDDDGNFAKIYTSRLAGMKLTSSDVSYYQTNSDGEITHLILDNATGDTYSYGYIISAETNGSDMQVSASYEYVLDGKIQTLNTSGTIYSAKEGGASFSMEESGKITNIKSLKSVDIDEISGNIAYDNNDEYVISDSVEVILEDGYISTNLNDLDTENYDFEAYYDSATEQIRVLIADLK